MAYDDRTASGQTIGGLGPLKRINEAASVERSPAIAEAFLTAEARVQDLNAIVTRLEQRLCVALRPVPPTQGQEGKNAEHPVQLVAVINRLQHRVDYEVSRLSDILDRLEL